jgi:hypothetical protein
LTTRARLAWLPVAVSSLSAGNRSVVDEGEQRLAGQAFGVGSPGAPLILLGDRRAVVVLHDFQLLVLIVDDLEKKHPAQLGKALGIAIDAGVLAHDVLDGFDCISG